MLTQKDVALRAEASTVTTKIQSFVPSNLIVVSVALNCVVDKTNGTCSQNKHGL